MSNRLGKMNRIFSMLELIDKEHIHTMEKNLEAAARVAAIGMQR